MLITLFLACGLSAEKGPLPDPLPSMEVNPREIVGANIGSLPVLSDVDGSAFSKVLDYQGHPVVEFQMQEVWKVTWIWQDSNCEPALAYIADLTVARGPAVEQNHPKGGDDYVFTMTWADPELSVIMYEGHLGDNRTCFLEIKKKGK